tara:strand:- start:10 stop:912 length:903 start_codon:yes stop_codon:yes gene_type:complete
MENELLLREKEIKKVLLTVLFLNLFIASLKIVVGLSSHYISLVSSGLDSLFDSASNCLALISIYFAFKPADSGHNYGHYKFETFGSLAIGALILFSGVQFLLSLNIFGDKPYKEPVFGLFPFISIVLSTGVSFFISKYEKKKGSELSSSILNSDSAHTFGDFLIGLGVLLSIVCSYFKVFWVDIFVGGAIGLYLFILGVKILRNNLPELLDGSPVIEKELVKKVEEIEHIRDIHKFRARGNQNCLFIDFHLLLSEDLSLKEAHKIGHDAEEMIKNLLNNYARKIDVTVHIEPYEENHLDD